MLFMFQPRCLQRASVRLGSPNRKPRFRFPGWLARTAAPHSLMIGLNSLLSSEINQKKQPWKNCKQMFAFKLTFSNPPKLPMIGQEADSERGGNVLKTLSLKCCRISPLCDIQPLIPTAQPSTGVRAQPRAAGACEAERAAAIVLSWAIRWTWTLLLSCRDPATPAIKKLPNLFNKFITS